MTICKRFGSEFEHILTASKRPKIILYHPMKSKCKFSIVTVYYTSMFVTWMAWAMKYYLFSSSCTPAVWPGIGIS